jgi:hypothetical protein
MDVVQFRFWSRDIPRNQPRKTAGRPKGRGLRLIQSLWPESGLASRDLSVVRASPGRRIGVSQVCVTSGRLPLVGRCDRRRRVARSQVAAMASWAGAPAVRDRGPAVA